jgi:protein TonB
MELKKSPKADLESKRKFFFQFGLVVAIAICLFGFETTKKAKPVENLGVLTNQKFVEELPPITRPEETKPQVVKLPKVIDFIVVDNNTDIKEDLNIIDLEANKFTAIDPTVLSASPKEIAKEEETIFVAAEEMPEFPGGTAALVKFLSLNIKYPAVAAETGIKGKVIVNFVVNKDGSITGAKILRSVDASLDKEALRVVNSLPRWKPGKQGGKPVRVAFSVPINFTLQN